LSLSLSHPDPERLARKGDPQVAPVGALKKCLLLERNPEAGTLGRLWSGCLSLTTARVGPRITPSQFAHSPQSPQKVRNSAKIGRRRPITPNHEAAGQAQVSSITTRSLHPGSTLGQQP
jgi:hypothetical protein